VHICRTTFSKITFFHVRGKHLLIEVYTKSNWKATVATREKAWVCKSTRPWLPCGVTLLMAVFFVHSVTDQPQTGTSGVVRHVQNHTGSLSSNQPCGPPCWANTLAFGLIGSDHRVHTEWQWPLPGVHSIMMEKSAQPAEDKGCTLHAPSPFHSIYHHKQSCGVPSSWEGRYTPPISPLPLYVDSGGDSMLLKGVNVYPKNYSRVRRGCVMKQSFYMILHQIPPKFPSKKRDCLNF
jgi:hypothetical protein